MHLVFIAIRIAFNVYSFILIARIIMSWMPNLNRYQPVIRFIYEMSDPYLNIFRRFIPPFGGMDFSPIVALIVLSVIENLILKVLVFLIY